MKKFKSESKCLFAAAILIAGPLHAQTQSTVQTNVPPGSEHNSSVVVARVWENEVGEGFAKDAQSIALSVGGTYGLSAFGTQELHDLAIVSFSYGHMLTRTLGQGRWWVGNPEVRLELFTGAQCAPSGDWFVGLTPHLRYNFATGTRLVPFFDGGAGVTATGIGAPDLSGTFEFNLQVGGGAHWFFRDNEAITLEARYMHWSDGGFDSPNLGLNGVSGLIGLSYFF